MLWLRVRAVDEDTRHWAAIAVLLAGVLLLGAYAVKLNRLYYTVYGPFYDSMAYMNQLAHVMETVRQKGLRAALHMGLRGTTVFLPWLEASVLGLFLRPLRELGVLIQLPLVAAMAGSAYLYLRRVAGYPRPVALMFAFACITFQGVFLYHSGLSNLRMDLSQALAYGAAVTLLAVARHTGRVRHWLLFGTMLGIALLFRATTPVYAVLAVAVLGTADLVAAGGQRIFVLKRYLLAGACALLLSLWFYVLNYKYLYYYYFVWNYDANASQGLVQSLQQFEFVFKWHLGWPTTTLVGLILLEQVVRRSVRREWRWREVSAGLLVSAAVPVAFLILSGASVNNPFVCMATVPALMLFCLAPFSSGRALGWLRSTVYVLACAWVIADNARWALTWHSAIWDPFIPQMAGVSAVTRALDHDIAAHDLRNPIYQVAYTGTIDNLTLLNSLAFDQGYTFAVDGQGGATLEDTGAVVKGDARVTFVAGGFGNPTEFNQNPGATPEEKLQGLAKNVFTKVDYVIVPEHETTLVPNLVFTPYAMKYRDMLLASPQMVRIAGPIRVSRNDVVSVYRNNRPRAETTAAAR
jgi:hypothetical protein